MKGGAVERGRQLSKCVNEMKDEGEGGGTVGRCKQDRRINVFSHLQRHSGSHQQYGGVLRLWRQYRSRK